MKIAIYDMMILLLCLACSQDETETFSAKQSFLFFTHSTEDSLSYSFFWYPDSASLTVPLEISLIGAPAAVNREFRLSVDAAKSSVLPEHYSIPEKLAWPANCVADTVYIQIHKTADLKTQAVRLVVRIDSSDLFLPGQKGHVERIVWFSDIISQPSWWDEEITTRYLGEYSEKKFREFIKVTGVGDLSELTPDDIWYLARKFKYYLVEQEKADTPVMDEDGNKMTVPVIG